MLRAGFMLVAFRRVSETFFLHLYQSRGLGVNLGLDECLFG